MWDGEIESLRSIVFIALHKHRRNSTRRKCSLRPLARRLLFLFYLGGRDVSLWALSNVGTVK